MITFTPHIGMRSRSVIRLCRSDETAVAINPKNPRNIVAGAVSFNGTQFINTAYVTKDRA